TPMSAVAVLTVEESFVLVKSPVTADGVISSVTPLPLDVLMVVSSSRQLVPSRVGVHSGLKAPVLELSCHTVALTAASKLPLDCAKAEVAASASTATAKATVEVLTICSPPLRSRGNLAIRDWL